MAISREKKKAISEKLKKILADSKSVIFVNFKSLSVGDSAAMRRELKDKEVSYIVAKKTLIGRVLDAKKPEGDRPDLEGELALAYLSAEASAKADGDPIAPAREIYSFQKKLEDKVSIIGGIFEGKYKSKEAMLEIAAIPSLETLRGMFVNVINSPTRRLTIALNEVAKIRS